MTDVQHALLILGVMPGLDGEVRSRLADRLVKPGTGADSGVLQALLEGRPGDLPEVPGKARAVLAKAASEVLREAELTLQRCRKAGITMLFRGAPGYPAFPARMSDAPVLLYLRGDTALLTADAPFAALVGTRRASQQGISFTRRSAAELADSGFVIVSGLALGIDAAAHQGALDADGRTVAILASSVDELTPRRNAPLGRRILEKNGAIVSERPPGTVIGPWSFPERNRIIAALGADTVITEAGLNSGSEHTAHRALDYGHDLHVMPGRPGDPLTAGGLKLLTEKDARLFTSAADLISHRELQAGVSLRLDPELLRLAQLIEEHLPCRLDALPVRLGLQDRIPVLIGGVNLLKLYGVLHEDGSGYLNLVAKLPASGPGSVNSA